MLHHYLYLHHVFPLSTQTNWGIHWVIHQDDMALDEVKFAVTSRTNYHARDGVRSDAGSSVCYGMIAVDIKPI